MTARTEALLLTAACLVLYLGGSADTPVYTRGEAREGLVVQEMQRTGEWLVPSRPDEPARKPPLFYWAAFAAHALSLRPESALRLPSAVFGTAAVLGTWATARAVFGSAASLPAGLVLATALEWMRSATTARVDMVLAAPLTLVLAAWLMMLERGGRGWMLLAATGAAAGTLAKGPVALVLPGLAAVGCALLQRDPSVLHRLRVPSVLGLAAVAASLWYGAAFARHGAAFLDVVARENWLRFTEAEEVGAGHVHGVGYLLVAGLIGLLPWTPLLSLGGAPLRERPLRPATALVAAWAAGVILFFSMSAGKRSVYLLPAYPALALLVGAGVAAPPGGWLGIAARRGAWFYPALLGLLATVALAYVAGIDPSILARHHLKADDAAGVAAIAGAVRSVATPLVLLALLSAVGAVFAARAAQRADWQRLVRVVGVLAVLWIGTVNLLIHPLIARDQSLVDFMARVEQVVPADATLYGFAPVNPQLRFYAPRPFALWPPGGLPTPSWVVAWEDEWRVRAKGTDRPLEPLAISRLRDPKRGHVLLLLVPSRQTLRGRDATPSPSAPPT